MNNDRVNSLFSDTATLPATRTAPRPSAAQVRAYAAQHGYGKGARLIDVIEQMADETLTDADYAPVYSGAQFECGEAPTLPLIEVDSVTVDLMLN